MHTRLWKHLLAALILLPLFLIGCGDDDDNGNGDGPVAAATPTPTPTTPTPTPPVTPQADLLQGNWRSTCRPTSELIEDDGPLNGSVIARAEFSENTVRRRFTLHSSTNCGDPLVTFEEVGTFTVGTQSGDNISPIDVSLTTVRVLPVNIIGELALEAIDFCGISNWQTGVHTDITAQTGSDDCWPQTPRTEFDIFRIDNSNTLSFGNRTDNLDATTAERRPTELSTVIVLTRE